MPPPISTSFLKGHASPGDTLWGEKELDWSGGLVWETGGKLLPCAQRLLPAWEGDTERNQHGDPGSLRHAEGTGVG